MSVYDYTVNYKFKLINYASQTWHEDEYSNWQMLDSIINASQLDTIPFAVATGAGGAYVVDYVPNTTIVVGTQVSFRTNHANPGAATLAVDGGAPIEIKASGASLGANILVSGTYVRVVYDGTNWLLVDPVTINQADGSITPTKLSAGHPSWDTSGNVTSFGNGNITASGTGKLVGADVLIGAKPAFRYNGAYASAVWYEGAGAPSGALGNDGDFYIRLS